MLVYSSPRELAAWRDRVRGMGQRIALVPTMGALHAGHATLLRAARAQADKLVASIFVNPTQFGPLEDFDRYPRQLDADQAVCREAGVDMLFCPPREDMYAGDHSVYVVEGRLTRGLCGPHRPGHFRGVLTVVAQLFNMVQPAVAMFGQKDAQQARLIQRMVRDLHMPVRVLIAPTVREADGLALSSRNRYLTEDERRRACALSQALRLGEGAYQRGVRDADEVCRQMRKHCETVAAPVAIDYVEAVDFERLEPVRTLADGVLLAMAARIGGTRLIDNILLGRERILGAFDLV
ncbi:MAG: pantoate--beta-alanine ligase [Lentisphaerae bacterium]|nr:pantoate--beta-alanine ligase [Lentisphaerota bacterium]